MTALAVAVAAGFAVVNGVNDGGTIVALGLRAAVLRPWVRVVVLLAVLGVAPWLLSGEVAATLAERLVTFDGARGQWVVIGAVVATLLVVWVIGSFGLPTSLTLGLMGALAGAGVAARLPVAWGTIGFVLAVAAVAPILGLVGAMLLHTVLMPLQGALPAVRRELRSLGFLLVCLAYGLNDGQKMLAVLAVVVGGSTAPADASPWLWLLIVAAFGLGTLIGVARVGPTVDDRVLPLRTEQVSLAQLSGAGAVLASSAVASPVSLIQSVTGGMIGAGVSVTARRIRWTVAGQIAVAWVVTLPAAFAVAAVLVAVGRWIA